MLLPDELSTLRATVKYLGAMRDDQSQCKAMMGVLFIVFIASAAFGFTTLNYMTIAYAVWFSFFSGRGLGVPNGSPSRMTA